MAAITTASTAIRFVPRAAGFTLIELATVLFIVALLIGGMLMPLSAQQDVRSRTDTDRQLAEAREALLGYVMVNDRFPCPATAVSNGRASPEGSGACTNPHDGFLPAATLGLSSPLNDGYAYDAWNNVPAHRLRYGLSTVNGSAFSTSGALKDLGIAAVTGDLVVCRSGTGISATACESPSPPLSANSLTSNAVAVIYSLGKNAPTGGTSTDEAPNLDGNRVFVSAPASPTYDDALLWISPNILVSRLVAAGRLP
jgi:type II secretory pathway pseudopilin PulG